jgi:hypothetical protein
LKDTYKSTPLQRSKLKEYRDNNNEKHVVVSPNYKTKIEFSTYDLTLSQWQELRAAINAAMENDQIKKIQLEYWDDSLLDYRTAWFEMSDITFPIKTIKTNDIKYSSIQFYFEEF